MSMSPASMEMHEYASCPVVLMWVKTPVGCAIPETVACGAGEQPLWVQRCRTGALEETSSVGSAWGALMAARRIGSSRMPLIAARWKAVLALASGIRTRTTRGSPSTRGRRVIDKAAHPMADVALGVALAIATTTRWTWRSNTFTSLAVGGTQHEALNNWGACAITAFRFTTAATNTQGFPSQSA